MQNNFARQGVTGNGHYWTGYAEAQQLVAEGNRLIAQEISDSIRGLLHRVIRSLTVGQHPDLPPI